METALDELTRHWGSAYRITHDARGWHAARRDGHGKPVTRRTSEELWPAIRADYNARPVPREAECAR